MNKKETLQTIADMRRRCGEAQFRVAIQHLFDTGHQNFNEKDVAEAKVTAERDTPPNSIMTAGFQCELLNLCLELSRLPLWDILLYVKLYLGMDGDDILLREEAERTLRARRTEFEPQSWRDACADPDLREEIVREMVQRHEDEFSTAEINAAVRSVVESE